MGFSMVLALIRRISLHRCLWACQLAEGSHTPAVSAPRAGRTESNSATGVIQPFARLSNNFICSGAVLDVFLGPATSMATSKHLMD